MPGERHPAIPHPADAASRSVLPDTIADTTALGVPAPYPRPEVAPVAAGTLPPPIVVRTAPGPLRPVRYELHRATGVANGYITALCVLVSSALLSVFLARSGHTPQPYLLAAWPRELPLPPAALGAGLLGALSFGDEFRHPALAVDRGTVPRRLGVLSAKLLVAAVTAVLFAALAFGCDAALLHLVYGFRLAEVPVDWSYLTVSWLSFLVGCAWAGVLAAGVFRSTAAGLAVVLAVPLVVVPVVRAVVARPSGPGAAGFAGWLRVFAPQRWPFAAQPYGAPGMHVAVQPVDVALVLSLAVLLGGYVFTELRTRAR
ncbi:hypothetical protein [Streptomyces sulfonofaciens]|uniref:hypothetical protein n=1 Tax=Streptomyces sulfonofaciens TaxID=68272 RepID=UPI0027E4CACA|nr:hypothetical protein [Streptomyces sulfonofaciens]